MQQLLLLFIGICLAACVLYFRRHTSTRFIWIGGIALAGMVAAASPWIMDRIGSAIHSIYILAGVNLAIFITTVILALHFHTGTSEKSDNEQADLNQHAIVLRYMYNDSSKNALSTRINENTQEDDGSTAITQAFIATASDSPLSIESGDRLPSNNRRRLLLFPGRAKRMGAPRTAHANGSIMPMQYDPLEIPDGSYENSYDYESAEYIPSYNAPSATQHRSEYTYEYDDRFGRTDFDIPLGIQTNPSARIDVFDEPDGFPASITLRSNTDIKPPALYEVNKKEKTIAKDEMRFGNRWIMEKAFSLKEQGLWSEAADAFFQFRESTQTDWLRKQADVERLGALIMSGRIAEAIDLVFFVLESGYSLTRSENEQIMEVLRRLQDSQRHVEDMP